MSRFLLNDGDGLAVVFVEAHNHDNEKEIYFTAILGTWSDEKDVKDHFTISCRYGALEGEDEYVCSLIDVPPTFDNSLSGKKLTRKEALRHDRVSEFWDIVDYLLMNDIAIHDFLFHPMKSSLKARLKLY